MSLTLVATPIGNPEDLTVRAARVLKEADIVIGEERKVVSKLLKHLGLTPKTIELLNEHSKEDEIAELSTLCERKNVALVSDCGTPSFCDPGAKLVRKCREKKIKVSTTPGASSLMTLLSLVSYPVSEFIFLGFLPANNEKRSLKLKSLKSEERSLVLMDTPYRLEKLLEELTRIFPNRMALLGLSLTQENEEVLEGKLAAIRKELEKKGIKKAEFVLLLY